jgi:hypothetical protein
MGDGDSVSMDDGDEVTIGMHMHTDAGSPASPPHPNCTTCRPADVIPVAAGTGSVRMDLILRLIRTPVH